MYWLEIFLWGFLGGGIIEGLRIKRIHEKGKGEFYYTKGEFLGSLFMAFVGGALAVAFNAEFELTPLTAIWIGASWPAILDNFVGVSPVAPKR